MNAPVCDPKRDIDIHVPVLVRVEGEGALEFTCRNGEIEELYLRIFEPPRLFEKFLQGQDYTEVANIAARVCGVCPIAYQMTSIRAMEKAFGIDPGPWVHAMRRVMYYGEWLQSHTLHVNLFAAPDFLGFTDAISMASKYPDEVRLGMRLQGLGNDILTLFGGRSVHPIGLRVGGFHRAPTQAEVDEMLDKLKAARADAVTYVQWVAKLPVPHDEQDFVSVAIRHPQEYAVNEGRLVSDRGLDIAFEDYPKYFKEHQVRHSTAFYALMDNKSYFLGPLSRMNLNFDLLPANIQNLAKEVGAHFPSKNMFHNVVARALECLYAIEDSINILEQYTRPKQPYVAVTPRAGEGYHCTEAPRGMIHHHFKLDEQGRVVTATMIPPTSQNQARIEENLHSAVLAYGLHHTDAELQMLCEKIIRNYDPCISCSTHFLKLKVNRK